MTKQDAVTAEILIGRLINDAEALDNVLRDIEIPQVLKDAIEACISLTGSNVLQNEINKVYPDADEFDRDVRQSLETVHNKEGI